MYLARFWFGVYSITILERVLKLPTNRSEPLALASGDVEFRPKLGKPDASAFGSHNFKTRS